MLNFRQDPIQFIKDILPRVLLGALTLAILAIAIVQLNGGRIQVAKLCDCTDFDEDGHSGDGYEFGCPEPKDCDDEESNTYPGNEDCHQDIDDADCDGKDDWNDREGCGRCGCSSPIVIDIKGDGFDLTAAKDGVNFDLNSSGISEKLSWTTPNSDDAWLVLDRNNNGIIENGQELFGNYSPQPKNKNPNGFIALAEYDKKSNGGNADGRIDKKDKIFKSLRLWQDRNHNGFSEYNELKTLTALDVVAIDLNYKKANLRDLYGNQFKYRAKVWDTKNAKVGRWSWDVYLMPEKTVR
jgi:hypothetical protein